MSFEAGAHRIIDLNDLINSNSNSILDLKKEFQIRGWAIIKFPDSTITMNKETQNNNKQQYDFSLYSKAVAELEEFFAQEQSIKEKTKEYSQVPHKESIHIITPHKYNDQNEQNNNSLSSFFSNIWSKGEETEKREKIEKLIQQWQTTFDDVADILLENFAESIFEKSSKLALASSADLPLAIRGKHHGMLDIARYGNCKVVPVTPEVGYSTEEVNCVPHYDPGLFSISFLSSCEGLQLLDPTTDTWHNGPVNSRKGEENLGVIWLGAIAKSVNPSIIEGVHRVVYPTDSPVPRLTAWYEVCTMEQYNREFDDKHVPKQGTIVSLPNLPKSKPLFLNPFKGKNQIEEHYGLPMSKPLYIEPSDYNSGNNPFYRN